MPTRLPIIGLILAGWLTAASAQLPQPVAGMLRAGNIPEKALGVLVLRLPDGTPILSHGAERSMQPGSTMKLLTTLVALDRLGPAYRGKTELRTNASIENGVLRGDLILRGGGDSDLSWEVLQGMLQTLRNRGVDTIQGDLLVDRTWFNPSRPDLGSPPFDEAPEFEYNLIPDALLLNSNLIRFELAADDRHLMVNMTPSLDRVSVSADMTLVDRDCKDWDADWLPPTYVKDPDDTIRIQLHGKYPKNCIRTATINVLDRVDYADRLFRTLWARLGGRFFGQTRDAAIPADTRLLAEHQSRQLPVIVRDINKQSDNALARMIYLTMGAMNSSSASGMQTPSDSASIPVTAMLSEQVVRTWLREQGINDQGLVLDNGSGLSRLELIRPAQMAALLLKGSKHRLAPEFLSSIPIAAVDGTMRLRLKDSPAAGQARIKTGTLNGVFGVAGFVPDAVGRMHVVVAFLNHPGTFNAAGRAILDALIDWVARSNLALQEK